ncbi:MAG: hypothetical protein ACM3ZB_16445 [bacterium]
MPGIPPHGTDVGPIRPRQSWRTVLWVLAAALMIYLLSAGPFT